MKKTTLAAGVLAAAILTGCIKEDTFTTQTTETSANRVNPLNEENELGDYVPGEVLIKFKSGSSSTGRANALARIGGQVKEHILTGAMRQFGDNEGVHLVSIPINALEAIGRVKGLPEVEYAELNWIYTTPVPINPTDPYYTGAEGQLWGMGSTFPKNYGSNADAAWRSGATGSKTVYVGVIDEGIQLDHPDLSGQIWVNPYDPKDRKDNDGNGYVDDVNGWDFASNDNTIYDGGKLGTADDHGTHVAGTIGAKQNGQGVIGVNWNITIISAKYLGRTGGTTANAVKAVDYFTNLKTKHGLNIVATNNSWGGGGYSTPLHEAIIRAAKADILFIAAAGNGGSDDIGDNNDIILNYPSNYNTTIKPEKSSIDAATYDAVIAVGAHKSETGQITSFSNFGMETVDLFAPGQAIASTTAYNRYEYYGGTSMATPHVTGGVALYASKNPNATASMIKQAILKSARPTINLKGLCATGARLDVHSAWQNIDNTAIAAD